MATSFFLAVHGVVIHNSPAIRKVDTSHFSLPPSTTLFSFLQAGNVFKSGLLSSLPRLLDSKQKFQPRTFADEICIKKSRSIIYFPRSFREDKSLNFPLSSREDFRPFDDKVKTFDEFGICVCLFTKP